MPTPDRTERAARPADASAEQRKQAVLTSLVALTALLANLPDAMTAGLGLQREWLLAVLGLIIVLGFFLFARFSLFFLTILLVLGANLPDRWATALAIEPFPLLVALGIMILGALINRATNMLPSGLEAPAQLHNADGTQALVGAIERGQVKAIRTVIDMNLDLNDRTADGDFPLAAAARAGNDDIVDLLLAHGANPTQTDTRGRSAADLAEQAGHARLAARLRTLPA